MTLQTTCTTAIPASSSYRPELADHAKDFGHTPGLGNTAARWVRRIGVEDLADAADAGIIEVRTKTTDGVASASGVFGKHLEPRIDERPDEPGPDRALVVRRIARPQVAVVARLEVGIAWRERTKADGCEQSIAHDTDDRFPPIRLQHR